MNDLDYIKSFSKIKVREICKKLNISESNIWSGKASKEKIKLVRIAIEKEIEKLQGDENVKISTL